MLLASVVNLTLVDLPGLTKIAVGKGFTFTADALLPMYIYALSLDIPFTHSHSLSFQRANLKAL